MEIPSEKGSLLVAILVIAAVCQASALNCQELTRLAALEDSSTMVDTSLKMLAGTWISEGCETRPGPEYVLRYYTFEEDGRYQLAQHHYWDDSCSSPQISIQSNGRIQLRSSLVQPGAAAGNAKVTNITVIPQDERAVKELNRRVSTECPGRPWKSWRKYDEHTVYDSRFDENKKSFKPLLSVNSRYSLNSKGSNVHFSDISCLGSLKWAFNELKLLKIELRPFIDNLKKVPREVKMELHLGDIHSNARLRQYYTPSSFQVPLVKQIKEPTQVFINRHTYTVKTTNVIPQKIFSYRMTPPQLLEKPHLPPYIWGDWVSSRCESRPGGDLYLTRKFSFNSDDSSWIGEHHFHSDSFCRIPKFTARASGHFNLQKVNKDYKGLSEIDFQIERTVLTVFDQQMINFIRVADHCGVGEWEINVPQELSLTGGCSQLGIVLPSIQLDVVKVEIDYKGSCLMFLGQVDTEFNMDSKGSRERPTAFQPPLVKCGEIPTYSPEFWRILNDQMYTYSRGHVRTTSYWNFWITNCIVLISSRFIL